MRRLLTRRMVMPAAYAARGELPYRARAELERSQWLAPDAIADLQLRKLRRIMRAAWRLPFHRARIEAAGLAPGRIETLADLRRLPPMDKEDLRRLAGEIELPSRLAGAYTRRQTAGTSGVPLTVYADGAAGAHSHAARMRSQGWYGISDGDRQARCWGRPLASGPAAGLRNMLLNRMLIHAADLQPARRRDTVSRLSAWRPDYVYGYSTLITMLADAVAEFGAAPPPGRLKAVICTAEMILAGERRRVAELLGCPVIGEYGCSETDIISFECPAGGHHVVAENVLLEVLPEPGGDGSTGEALVTDLNNALTPLLRYRLGDVVTLKKGACPCGRGLPLLEAVRGRHVGQYIVTPDGRRVHSVVFAYLVERLLDSGTDIRRFRIVQEAPDLVRVLLVPGPGCGHGRREEAAAQLRRGSARELGPDVACRVEFVAGIPREVDGKHSYFVPLAGEVSGRGCDGGGE